MGRADPRPHLFVFALSALLPVGNAGVFTPAARVLCLLRDRLYTTRYGVINGRHIDLFAPDSHSGRGAGGPTPAAPLTGHWDGARRLTPPSFRPAFRFAILCCARSLCVPPYSHAMASTPPYPSSPFLFDRVCQRTGGTTLSAAT